MGTHTETPVMMASGCPRDSTRIAPITHCPVTHGPFPAGGTNAHPATAYGTAMVATGIPETSALGFGAVGTACPPCEQSTVAPKCKIGPGTLEYLVKACPTYVGSNNR